MTGEPATAVLGAAVIGAGDMGARHARHWRAAGAKVVGVFDPYPGRAEVLARGLGAEAYGSLEEMLAVAELEVVSVCTPTFLHAPQTIQALEAGKHVLCEKPAALTLEGALAMRRAAQLYGRELRIGFMRRFDPADHRLMDFRARIGSPVLAQATIVAGVRPKLLMHDRLANGGPIIDMCCHIFNLWGRMFGCEPDSVSAQGYTFSDNKPELAQVEHKALDSAQVILEYPGGSVGSIQVSWGLPSGVKPFERHTYIGPDGVISLRWPDEIALRDAEGTTRWGSAGYDPWKAEIGHFYKELSQGAPVRLATIDEGIAALKTSLAVLESVAAHRPVRLAEPVAGSC
jgi:predicted dehydrogenase